MKDMEKYCRELFVYLRDQNKMFKEKANELHLGRDEEELFGHDRPYALAFMHNALIEEQSGRIPDCLFFAILLRMTGVKFVPSEKYGMRIVPVLNLPDGFTSVEDYRTFMSCFTDLYGSTWLLNTLKSIATI